MKDSILGSATEEDLERLRGAVSREAEDATLDNWRIMTVSLPKNPERRWTFVVAETPPELRVSMEWPNMPHTIVTSDLIALDLNHDLAETKSRSVYRLGARARGFMPAAVEKEVLHRFWSHR